MTYHSSGFAEYALTFKKKTIKTYLNSNVSAQNFEIELGVGVEELRARNYRLDIGLDTGLDTGLDMRGGKSACLYVTYYRDISISSVSGLVV